MAKDRHRPHYSIEGTAARSRMSSIPPQIQKGIESGTFPVQRLPIEEKRSHIWNHLEKMDDLPERLAIEYNPHGGNPHHWGLYILADIDEFDCLPSEVKNALTEKLLRFIKKHTVQATGETEKKYRLPTKNVLRQRIVQEVMKIAEIYEDYPNTPDEQLERINFWFHRISLSKYTLFRHLPFEIKRDIAPSLVGYMRSHENAEDEEIEVQVTMFALQWMNDKTRIQNPLEPNLPKKTLREWQKYLLQSPISIRLVQNTLYQKIDALLNED